MREPNGSWSGATGGTARTAAEQDLRYGSGLLHRESGGWPSYFAVTSPSAYRAAAAIPGPRAGGGSATPGCSTGRIYRTLPTASPPVSSSSSAVGGGVAVDASKYVALKKGLPLVLVPTIVSTGAIIHSFFAKWKGHKTIDSPDTWPWINFDHAVIDYDLVLEAPYYLNTAGLGDVLCGYSGFCEWRRNARLGIGEPFDESAAAPTADYFRQIVEGFPLTLDSAGGLTPDSVRLIMEAVRDRDAKSLRIPAAPMADHPLWLAAEEINGRTWIHGEFVALSAVVIAWRCEEGVDTLTGWLDACKVRWRPGDVGVAREELLKALEHAPAFMSDASRGNDVRSILRERPITGATFDALWSFLQSA